jgi:hypothetical protein
MNEVVIPATDINGKPFSERDRKLLIIFLRPDGGSLEAINRAVVPPGKKAAYSYINDSKRLAKRLSGAVWTKGAGGTCRFGIRLPISS